MGARAVAPAVSRLTMWILSEDDAGRLHAASLDYLGEVGVTVPGAARAALRAAGAAADETSGVVRVAAPLVEQALGTAPPSAVLGGRDETHDITVGEGSGVLASGGPVADVRDAGSGERRAATAEDFAAACRIADALPEIGAICPPLLVRDVPALSRIVDAAAACWEDTSKHVHVIGMDSAEEAERAAALAAAVAGSEDEARRRPPLSLGGGAPALDAALVFARRGLPVSVAAAPAAGAPAPADVGAALVLANACVLGALTAVQTAAPGAPFFYAAHPEYLGWASGPASPFATGPAASVFALAAGQLAARYGLPFSCGLFRTWSHEPDWQASAQDSFAALSATLGHAGLTTGAGTLGGSAVFSAQQLVMDAEIYSVAARIAAGIAVEDETIALDTIARVGIGGNYLGERHTRAHMKEVWRPRLLDRSPWDSWVRSGRAGSYEKASALVADILETHTVPALSAQQHQAIDAILAAAD